MKNSSKEKDNRETKRPKITPMEEPPLACLRTVRRKPSANLPDSSGVDSSGVDDAIEVVGREISAFTPLSRGSGGGSTFIPNNNAESRLGSLRSCPNEKKEEPVDDLESSIKPIVPIKNPNTAADVHEQDKSNRARPNEPNEPTPTKSPKQSINEYYSKHHHLTPSQLKTLKTYYTTVKHSNLVKYACVLTCPVSGEHFLSGRMKDAESMEDVEGVLWYSNTKLATTAAAARAMDCFIFRDFMNKQMTGKGAPVPQHACLDAPYLKDSGPPLPKLFGHVILPCAMDLGTDMVSKPCAVKGADDTRAIHTSTVEPNANLNQNVTAQKPSDVVVGESSTNANNDANTNANNNGKQNISTRQPNNVGVRESNQDPVIKLEDNKPEKKSPTFHKIEPVSIQQSMKIVPKQELNEYYTKLGLAQSQISLLRNYYVVWSFRFPKEIRYTCIFVCPLTLEGFQCGHVSDLSGGVIVHESLFWYQSKQLAKDASAAKALDCFAYRDCHGSQEKYVVRCQDMPYLKENAPTLPSLPDGVVLPTSILTISGKPKLVEKKSPARQSQETKVAVENDADTSPKQALKRWYETYWRRISKTSFTLSHTTVTRRLPEKDNFATWSNLRANGKPTTKLFTSVFVCPWTGERFLSGKLAGRQLEYLEQDSHLGEQGAKEGAETKTLVWYRTKKDAENAAAGRALDCLCYRDVSETSVTVIKSTKYCTDAPYGTNAVSEQDITQRLTCVPEVCNDTRPPIYFKLPWKVVPLEERIQIRYRGETST